jgi:TetR/AcrR family transcriptional repressor of nem operon
MSRHKEFDEAEVLDQAVELFRARGFLATSFCDLTAGLGVSRQSLYDTYGDKRTLFHAAVRRYRERSLDRMRRALATPGPVRPILSRIFDGAIEGSCGDGNHGCLMVNSMVEMAPHDDAVRALALAHARDVEGLLAARLSAAQRTGDIGRDKDSAALARYLFHTMLGFAVAARALGEHDSLRDSARLALQALD